MNIATDIHRLIQSGAAAPSPQWVEAAAAEYPYFVLPLLLSLKNGTTDADSRNDALRRVALICPDRIALYDVVGEDAARFANFYPPEPQQATPTTDATIDSFLDRYGDCDDKEISALEKLIFSPVPDYSLALAAEEENSVPTEAEINGEGVSEKESRINSFIAKSKQQSGHFPATVVDNPVSAPQAAEQPEPTAQIEKADMPDNSTFSESLAKIYIRQGKYGKALEIIKNINLNFPGKNIYFADQIRFLRKLMVLEEINNKK